MLNRIITLALALIAAPASAQPSWQHVRAWEFAYQGLNAVDTVQTLDFLHRGKAHELNPLLGKHPSDARLILTKVAFGAVHFVVIRKLYEADPTFALRAAQLSVVVQGGVVAANLRFAF